MLRNYFITAWRNLVRSRVYSIIAILGLAIGLSISILIFWRANDELSYDTAWPDAPAIYRLNTSVKTGDNKFDAWTVTPFPIAGLALKNFPGIESATHYQKAGRAVITIGTNHFLEKEAVYTDSSFFGIFHINLLEGTAGNAFAQLNNIVVSRDNAVKYFGSPANAIGKTLLFGDKQEPFIVGAVMENMPGKSSIRLNTLLSYEIKRKAYRSNAYWKGMDDDWGNFSCATFLKIKPGTDISLLEHKLTAAHLQHNHYVKPGDVRYLMQPLNMLRLYNPDLTPDGIKVVHLFILIGALIIVIAVINYVNLSTARATKRAREVGLRKVVGANRRQLVVQFTLEFLIIFFVSLVIALLLLPLITPFYQSISGKNYRIDYWQPAALKIIGLVAFGTVVLGSIYPAWLLSCFNPIQVLKSNFSKASKGSLLRKGLVIIQFSFSIILIICTLIVSKQLHFIQTKQLGFNKENVFTVELNQKTGKQLGAIMHELRSDKSVAGVSFATDNILSMGSSTDNIKWPGKPADVQAKIGPMEVAYDFTSMMQMQFAAGDGFTGTAADSGYYLVNEAAVKEMNLKNPVGARIGLWDQPGQIKGVLKDFNNTNLKGFIEPTILLINKSADWGGTLYVKTMAGEATKAVEATEKICRSFDQLNPFEYQFLDDNFDAMYRSEAQTASIFRFFAAIAVILSCMGLFGLSVFTAERRTKEIGIRKVLGASVQNISVLLSREFAWLVIIANVIAWPVSWYAMNKWIQDFAYRTSINWWIFASAGMVALVLAVVTIISQAVKASIANPVKSLRAE